ncbi:MAG: ribosome recycling factor [Gammaproteobacteria bacterium]|jgi:ribosome recycling factor|nr:ribosome recycling factor [Gammaproteobacteria bacterium]MCP4881496.1 ribosome recycling factor [Gammaproteobacteria bacterium]MDP6166105.1 ribosome recycling factor [Gammaproteobacteria bacterium]
MINDIRDDADERMAKTREALDVAFKKIRTGRAHPSILDSVMVSYYGSDTPLNQLANINVEDGRTLAVVPWEKPLIPEIEKAIMKADLGLNPATSGEVIRVPMPALTEETRRGFIRQAREEAEKSRISVRNIRRDANGDIKELLKDKDISEDDARRGEEAIQKVTDKHVELVDQTLAAKEKDLMEV